jgi:hypothetical protein
MIFRQLNRQQGRGAALALAGALALAVMTAGASSERMVQSGFDVALSSRATSAPDASSSRTTAESIQLAQSEEFWLRNGRNVSNADIKPIAWSGQLSPGDRLTITPAGSDKPHVFEVVEASPVASDSTHVDMGLSEPLLAVTCRDVSAPDAQLVRMIVSERSPLLTVTKASGKAL